MEECRSKGTGSEKELGGQSRPVTPSPCALVNSMPTDCGASLPRSRMMSANAPQSQGRTTVKQPKHARAGWHLPGPQRLRSTPTGSNCSRNHTVARHRNDHAPQSLCVPWMQTRMFPACALGVRHRARPAYFACARNCIACCKLWKPYRCSKLRFLAAGY